MAEGLGVPGLPHVQGYRWGDAGTCLKKDKHIGRQVSERGFQRWDQVCPWVLPATDHGTPAPQLMKCVRLPLLSRDFLLGHVDAEGLVRHHPDCKDLLIEALKFHLLPEQRGVLGTSRTRPRRCEGAGPVLFAVGMPSCPAPPRPLPLHAHLRPVSLIHEPSTSPFHPYWSRPAHTPHLLRPPGGTPCVVTPSHVPIATLDLTLCSRPPTVASLGPWSCPITSPSLGGGSLFAIHGDCEAYDMRTDRWHMVASMSTRRARVGVAAVGNRLYAVGG